MHARDTNVDVRFFSRAMELASTSEDEGNLPIGAVIVRGGQIIAEGRNAIWFPSLNGNRHAEIEALRAVPQGLWRFSRQMTLYTTLEPCLMCLGAILLHQLGRIVFGSCDDYGGAGTVFGHMPPFFEEQLALLEWVGPAYPELCDPLSRRATERSKEWLAANM